MRDERGAVMVIFALALPVLLLFVMFGIDVANWFDYSRNLQNRADAAALAAGLQYGGTCEDTNPSPGSLAAIGQVAQNYSGAGPSSDLYYPYDAAGTKNIPNLKSGSLGNYHVLINSQSFWQPGQTSTAQSFTMGKPSTVCSSVDENGNRGPFIDVKVTQDSLPLFLPLVRLRPTITAEARVSLEQVTSEDTIRPLAVRDDAAISCVSVNFVNATTNTVIKTVALAKDSTGDPNFPTATLWDNPSGATVQLPPTTSLADVYVQPFLNDCNGGGTKYDGSSGLSWINVYGSSTPTNGNAPAITTGGASLIGCSSATGAFNPYFTSTTCTPSLIAFVAFAPNVPSGNQSVTVTDSAGGQAQNLVHVAGNEWEYDFPASYLASGSGQHAFDIKAIQTAGSVNNGATACGTGGKTKPCTTELGVQQQAFGACDGCGDPDESGAIQSVRVQLPTDQPGDAGRNALAAGTSPTLEVKVVVQGLHFDAPGQPATVLRFGVQSDKATGLIDCGQKNGASGDAAAITNGCPEFGSPACANHDFCAPYTIYNSSSHTNGTCDPELRETPNPTFSDCVSTMGQSGQRRNKIPGSIANIIVKNNVCSPNHWPEYSSNPTTFSFPPGDPRAITMIITSPADLSTNATVPIRNFATFYVTGWDTGGNIATCTLSPPPSSPPFGSPPAGGWGNEPYAGSGSSNGAIWGHWIFYTDPSASSNGAFCSQAAFGVCTPALSR